MQWATIEQLVLAGDHRPLTTALLEVTDTERRGLVAPLKAMVRLPAGQWHPFEREPMFTLVGAAVLPNASTLAPWLRRYRCTYWVRGPGHDVYAGDHHDVTDDLFRILVARDVGWLADLAVRTAERLPTARPDHERQVVVERLLELTGASPPDTDGYLVGVVLDRFRGRGFLDRARADPRLAALTPRLFELEPVTNALGGHGSDTDDVSTLVAEGLVDRAAVLDAAVARLQRPGRPGATAGFTTIVQHLAPTPDELATRTRGLLAAVPGATSALAGVLQAWLTALSDTGRLDRGTELEAGALLLARPEKKIVRAALVHLTALGERDTSFGAAAAETVATTFGQPAVDLQRAAVDLLLRWAGRLDPAARAAVTAAAVDLPTDLRTRLGSGLGVAAPIDDVVAPGLPPVPPPVRLHPLVTPTELVDRIVALSRAGARLDPVDLELTLEGLVRWSRRREEVDLRAVLRPVLESHPHVTWCRTPDFEGRRQSQVAYAVQRVVAAAVGEPLWDRLLPARTETTLHTVVLDRIEQLADDLATRPGPSLVSWPSTSTGAVGVGDLLERLRLAADEGWEPWDDDLEAALLRLDHHGAGADAVAAFASLDTTVGRRVAEVLRSGPPTVTTRAVWGERTVSAGWWVSYSVDGVDQDPLASRPPDEIEQVLLAAVDTGSGTGAAPVPAWSRLVPLDPAPRTGRSWSFSAEVPHVYSSLLPCHRDVVAAHLTEAFRTGTTGRHAGGDVVVTLAAADGTVGDALYLVLAYALGAHDTEVRAAATDAVLVLAARSGTATTRLGELIGALCTTGEIVVTRVVGPLRDAAVSGAAVFLWPAVSALVSTLAGAPEPGSRFADVLALATEVAELAGATEEPLGLARFADRSGRARAVVEAQRLRAVLVGAAPATVSSSSATSPAASSPPATGAAGGAPAVLFDGDMPVADGFLVLDSGVGGRDERYGGPAGQRNGLLDAVQPGLLTVLTGAIVGPVRVRVERWDVPPSVVTDAAEIVEVSCDLRGPDLTLGPPGQPTSLQAGSNGPHRVRLGVWDLESGREGRRRDARAPVRDRYLVQLWPAATEADSVVRTMTATAAFRHRDAATRPHPVRTARDIAVADRARSEQEEARARAERSQRWGGRQPTPELLAVADAATPLVQDHRHLVDRIIALPPDTWRRLAVEVAQDACARDDGPIDWTPALRALAGGDPLPVPFDDPAAVRALMFGTAPTYKATSAFVVGVGGARPARQPLHTGVAADAAVRAAADTGDPLAAALRALHAASWSVADVEGWYAAIERRVAELAGD